MKYPPNPKTEIRKPKEDRRPKSESDEAGTRTAQGSNFWAWGDDCLAGALALKEDTPSPSRPPKELGERTAQFGEAIVRFAKRIPQNPVNSRLIDQLVGAGTSVGPNFCEADNAVSGEDFKQRIGTCRKESRETMFFLRMVAAAHRVHILEKSLELLRFMGERK